MLGLQVKFLFCVRKGIVTLTALTLITRCSFLEYERTQFINLK